jgi:hypothetical protein
MAETFAESKIYIGTTAPIDFTTDETAIADFAADDFKEIKEMSNMGDFGKAANVLTFQTVSERYSKKGKGGFNAGDPVVTYGRDPLDEGQARVDAAVDTKYYYNFKLELADAISENYTNSVIYFRALVASLPGQFGGQESFMTKQATLAIYPAAIEVPTVFVTSP